jgi:dynein heavy chain 1
VIHLLHVAGGVSTSEDKMQVFIEGPLDLRGVWSELSRSWTQTDEIHETLWLSVQSQELDTLMAQLKDLPARLRQYSSYEYVKKLLQGYTKVRLVKKVVLQLPLVSVMNLELCIVKFWNVIW